MEEITYLVAVAQYFCCNTELAKKIVKSSEMNNTKKELDQIVSMLLRSDKHEN